jgi:tRNA(Met) C34 N-acetyltransferase TmcA
MTSGKYTCSILKPINKRNFAIIETHAYIHASELEKRYFA